MNDLRDRIAAAIAVDDGHPWDTLCADTQQHYVDNADAVLAVLPAPVVLTAVERQFLAFALDLAFDRMVSEGGFTDEDHAALDKFRRMADEAQQPEGVPAPQTAVCEGFQWIGQSFAICERCGQPAWEHTGEELPAEGAGLFDTRRTVRPWKPGEADAIRAKWSRPAS